MVTEHEFLAHTVGCANWGIDFERLYVVAQLDQAQRIRGLALFFPQGEAIYRVYAPPLDLGLEKPSQQSDDRIAGLVSAVLREGAL